MMPRILAPFALAVFLFTSAAARPTTLIPFTIKDQFDTEYTQKNFANQISIWIGSDKDGSKYNAVWGDALRESIHEAHGRNAVRFVGISDLRGVPSFLKGFVRGKFPKEKDNRVLMDWKGVFAERYEWQKGACNILIFSARGALVHQATVRRMDHAKKGEIIRHVGALLARAN